MDSVVNEARASGSTVAEEKRWDTATCGGIVVAAVD
jgi:hypothetical protein